VGIAARQRSRDASRFRREASGLVVGASRFELLTPGPPCQCATRLRHAPILDFSIPSLSAHLFRNAERARNRAREFETLGVLRFTTHRASRRDILHIPVGAVKRETHRTPKKLRTERSPERDTPGEDDPAGGVCRILALDESMTIASGYLPSRSGPAAVRLAVRVVLPDLPAPSSVGGLPRRYTVPGRAVS
jgi:hypothetical protein